jgi:hypothetical protein
METMILVAGLAVAGLIGIAAAFYFSMRSGRGGNKRSSRGRSADTGRVGADRRPAGRRSGTASADRPVNARRAADNGRAANPRLTANADLAANTDWPANTGQIANAASRNYRAEGRTGPNNVMDFDAADDPGLVEGQAAAYAGRRARPDPLDRAANAAETSRTAKSRRRVGFRKGAEIDEEMWPSEAFGVSDDQFWDDMASDKPLTTTARSAPHDSAAKNQSLAAVGPAGAPPGQQPGGVRGQYEAPGEGDAQGRRDARGRGDSRARGRRAWNSSASQEPGAYAESAAEGGTAILPAQSATQPVQGATQPVQPATQPVQAAPPPVPAMPGPGRGPSTSASPFHAAPVHAASMWAGQLSPADDRPSRSSTQPPRSSTQPPRSSTQPSRPPVQPGEARGRRHDASPGPGASVNDDPLTSAAFSLRSSGPVDGNSQQIPRRSQDFSREQHDAVLSQETQMFRKDGSRAGLGRSGPSPTTEPYGADPGSSPGYSGTSPYPYGRPYSDPVREVPAPQPAGTPPYGQTYGYPGPAAPADDPRQLNGARSHARHSGGTPADGDRPARPAYPPRNGYQPGGPNQGANQGDGRQGDTRQGRAYDPREEYRGLTRQR